MTKLLMLTTSNFDGECLNAIRKANEILKSHKLSWEEFLNNNTGYKKKENPYEKKHSSVGESEQWSVDLGYTKEEWLSFFSDVISKSLFGNSSFGEFMTSIKKQYSLTGRLSEKQWSAIRKTHNNFYKY